MPQFELTFYLSQAFWMLISFGGLFFVVSAVIFPALNEAFSKRRMRIDGTLEKAARLNERAEKLMHEYDIFMADATRVKNETVRQAYAKITRENAEVEAQNDQKLRALIQQTETQIEVTKNHLDKRSDEIAAEIATKLAYKFFHPKEG